ncbi:MAG: hypothetical protein HRU26_17720 [Psychroserpens sp.]|nr:hypothetical protein [Psychroserpens sp.]
MKHSLFLFVFILNSFAVCTKSISGSDLLDLSIQFHDPEGHWDTFSGEMQIVMNMPERSERTTVVSIDLPKEYFKTYTQQDSITTTMIIDKSSCQLALNGNFEVTQEDSETYKLNCDRALLYKNYYTYLYGLPMKLKDEGTTISDKVELVQFKGESYYKLDVSYEEKGGDLWHFYFDPQTYALKAYQFFKTDREGNMKPKSGEYILLSELETISGIKMPKVRAWYYNKDESYLATDTLKQ